MNDNTIFDIGSLDVTAACDKGAEITLRHPVTNAELNIHITVLGKDSQVCREILREQADEDMRNAQRRRGTRLDALTSEQLEKRGTKLLAACTTAWRTGDEPVIVLHGERLTASPANAIKLYEKMPWIRSQVDVAIADLENFMRG